MTDFSRAPEVEKIAASLIQDVADHQDLHHARIEYVWKPKASRSAGRVTLASVRKVGGLNAFLVGIALGMADGDANEPFFVMQVAKDTWLHLNEQQRVALVDHELCHLEVDLDDDGVPHLSMRGHDLEEFASIVKRHGLWKSDVVAFGDQVIEQLALALENDSEWLNEIGISDPPAEGDEP